MDNQLREPRATAERHGWEVIEEFIDRGISGAKGRDKRPGFDGLWKAVARKQFDVVMVWSVDRLGRSLQHLVEFLSELHSKRIDLFIHQQGIDTTTPAGKALFGMLGIFAEFERSIIQARVKAGIKRYLTANPQKSCGRVPLEQTDPKLASRIIEKRREGLGMKAIAKELGVSSRTVWRLLQQSQQAAA